MRRVILSILTILALTATSAFAQNSAYVTPDSWSKHITANGVKASSEGLSVGGGNLKIGLTTRAQLRFGEESDTNIYQYARAKLSGYELGSGEVNINLNVRGSWDSEAEPTLREFHVYWDGHDVSRDGEDLDFRIYQANVELNGVLPYTDIALGRVYLPAFNSYKIDGGNIAVSPVDWLKVNVFYGLPVSYYSYLETQVVGGGVDVPIESTGTRVRGEYSYFMHEDGGDYDTSVAKARLDQRILFANLYAEGAMIGDAWTYDVGVDGNISASNTGFSAYIMGQYDKNDGMINPYVGMFESELGASSEYLMGGVQVMQGITDYVMLSLGFESRFNYDESYGDRDYYRFFGTVDLVGLLHRNNYLSLIADYYTVEAYQRQDENSKLLFGLRMTQVVNDNVELWLGANVMNYQYHANPIKYYQGETGFSGISQAEEEENTTLAYIGGMWQVADWCVLQVDYTFEYSDIFDSLDMDSNLHMVELWLNFLW